MSDIEWSLIVSSSIVAIGYDRDKRELHVQFNSGAEYVYNDVPPEIAQGLLDAESKGKYLNGHIKGVYEYKKLE